MSTLYTKLQPANQARILSAYIAHLRGQINAGDEVDCRRFAALMQAEGVKVQFDKEDYINDAFTPENHWGSSHDFSEQVRDINLLLQHLPVAVASRHFSCEVLRCARYPDLLAFVREQASSRELGQTEFTVVIVSHEPLEIDKAMIHVIAEAYRRRRPEFSGAYEAVTQARKLIGKTIQIAPDLKGDPAILKPVVPSDSGVAFGLQRQPAGVASVDRPWQAAYAQYRA